MHSVEAEGLNTQRRLEIRRLRLWSGYYSKMHNCLYDSILNSSHIISILLVSALFREKYGNYLETTSWKQLCVTTTFKMFSFTKFLHSKNVKIFIWITEWRHFSPLKNLKIIMTEVACYIILCKIKQNNT